MSNSDFAVVLAVGALLVSLLMWSAASSRLDRLQSKVDCLEHPHGESSVAVQIKPTYKVIQPATETGCP